MSDVQAPAPAATGSAPPQHVQEATALGTTNRDFTPDQLRTMAADLVGSGKLSQAEADAALKADGVEAAQPAADTGLSAQAAEIDAAFPAARATDYEIPPLAPGNEPLTKELMAFDRQARGWLEAARFTKGIGSFIAREVEKVGVRYQAMSESERKLFAITERQRRDQLLGPNAEKRVALGRQLVRELDKKSPGLVALLEETGAGNSAAVIVHFTMQAERLAARRA